MSLSKPLKDLEILENKFNPKNVVLFQKTMAKHQGVGAKKKYTCPAVHPVTKEQCGKEVVNMNRHLRNYHGPKGKGFFDPTLDGVGDKWKKLKSRGKGSPCPFCKLRFAKLKYHIKNVHELSMADSQSSLHLEEESFKSSLDEFLESFEKDFLLTRLGGTSFDTSNSSSQQVKAEKKKAETILQWLSKECDETKFNISTCIDATEKLSKYLDDKKDNLSPKTLLSHLTTFKKILTFLRFDNGKRFQVKKECLEDYKEMVEKFQSSLKPSIKIQETRVLNREASFDLTVNHIRQYENCSASKKAERDILKTLVSKLKMSDIINCRQHLMLQIVLVNRGRGIELRTLKMTEVQNVMKVEDNYVIKPLDHKTGKSGKEAFIVLKEKLYKLLISYIERIRPITDKDNGSNEVFLNAKGNPIPASSFTAIFNDQWQKGSNKKKDLPPINSRLLRKHGYKLVVESNADQRVLNSMRVKMAHNESTSNRYYQGLSAMKRSIEAVDTMTKLQKSHK